MNLYLASGIGGVASCYLLNKAWLRLPLSRAKHPHYVAIANGREELPA